MATEDPPGFGNAELEHSVDAALAGLAIQATIPLYLGTLPPHMQWVAKVQALHTRPDLPAELFTLTSQLSAWLTRATFLEMHIARALDPARVLQPEDVASRWRTAHLEEAGIRMPSLSTSFGTQPPRWVVGRIVDQGARSMHQVVGPMPYWFGTFEERTTRLRSIGLTHPTLSGRILQLWLICDDNKGSPAHIPFTFHLDYATHLVDLAYAVAVGEIRIDLFHLTPAVEHLQSLDLSLPKEMLDTIRALLSHEFATKWNNDLDRLNAAFVQAHSGDAATGFMIAEWSKAEDIVEDIGLDAAARTNGSWEHYNTTRTAWLVAEGAHTRHDLASALTGHSPAESSVAASARSSFLRARDRVRADHSEAFEPLRGEARLTSLRRSLGHHEAFVHLSSSGGTLFAFVAQGGLVEVAEHHFYKIPLPTIAELVSQPRSAPKHFNGLRLALSLCAKDLGELLAQLLDNGVRNVFVSLPGVIDELPIHMLEPTGHTLPAFALFDAFTYCSSAVLLSERARRRPLVYTNNVSIIAHEGLDGLMGLEEEVQAVADAWRRPDLWLGEAATPARALACLRSSEVVHIACHGYASQRPLGSGLELYDAVRSQGFLTAADLLAIPPLETAASIVVLSSCFGGAHGTARDVVHRFSAFDNVLIRLGVRCVVSSTRALNGIAATAFSRTFHESLSSGSNAASSYRQAMCSAADALHGNGAAESPLEALCSIRLVGDGVASGPGAV
jgi:hypothetical protein